MLMMLIWFLIMLIQGGFLTAAPPPHFQYQKENRQSQPFVFNKIYWNSSCDWLIGDFLFGTKIGGAS